MNRTVITENTEQLREYVPTVPQPMDNVQVGQVGQAICNLNVTLNSTKAVKLSDPNIDKVLPQCELTDNVLSNSQCSAENMYNPKDNSCQLYFT